MPGSIGTYASAHSLCTLNLLLPRRTHPLRAGTVVAPAAGGGASASPAGAPTPEGMVPVAAPPAAMDDTPLASQPLVAKFASAAKDGLGVAVEASNDGPAVAAAMEEGQPAPAANGAAGAAAVENGRAHKRRRNVPTSMYTRTRTRARMAAKVGGSWCADWRWLGDGEREAGCNTYVQSAWGAISCLAFSAEQRFPPCPAQRESAQAGGNEGNHKTKK